MGWLPWWTVLGLVLALAVTRREGEARTVRVPLLLLGGALGLALLLPGMRGPEGAIAFMRAFLTVMGGTVLVYLGVTALEGRRVAWGAGWLGVLLLLGTLVPLAVSPAGLAVGLLALVLTLLGTAGVEERPPLRLAGGRRAVLGVGGAGLGAAALLALLALALPGSPGERLHDVAPVSTQAPAREAAPPTRPPVSGAGEAARPREVQPTVTRPRGPVPGTDLALLGGLLFILALAFALWRAGQVGPGRLRLAWWEVAAVLSVLLTAALLFVFGLAARSGGAGGLLPGLPGEPSGAAAGRAPRTDGGTTLPFLDRWLWGASLLTFVVFTLLAGALVWLALRSLEPPEAAPDLTAPDLSPPSQEGALHRVRLAYRAALASLAGAGLGRGQAETPAEHAGRAARELPSLAGPLGRLVTAYAPVRYGGRVTDEDADAAERAAREVAQLTADLHFDLQDTESGTP